MEQKKSMWAVKVDERGRITVPKELLELLGMTSNDTLAFVRENEGPIYVGKAQFQVEIPFIRSPGGETRAPHNQEKPEKPSRRK
jgi:AbrB family looped-hinge helix DNA binding protein